MANHRKISANRNKQAKRLAVLAFLGLAVASPGIATASADATEGSSASTDAGAKTDAGPKGEPDGDNDAGIGDAESDDGHVDDEGDDPDDDADDLDEEEDESDDAIDDVAIDDDAIDDDAEEGDAGEIDESEPPLVEGDDTNPEPTQSSGAAATKAALRNVDPESVDTMSMTSIPTDLESSSITAEPDETVAPQQAALVETLADPEVDEKSPWDFLPQYPEIAGVTNTEVAAVVFIAAAAATVISIPTAPLLTIPLLLVTIAAWTRFEDLGTNHYAPTAQVTNTIRALGVVTGTLIGNDEDGDPVNITLENGPANGNVQIIGSSLLGGFQYIYTANNPLTLGAINDSFTIKIDDYGGWRNHPLGLHAVSMTIDVTSGSVINGFPVFTQQATIVSTDPETQQMQGTFAATDPDGTPLTFTGFAVSSLLGTTVQVTSDEDGNGTFVYTPSDAAIQAAALDILGIGDLITITATDANGGFAISTVTVYLEPDNRPPLVVPVGTAIPDLISGVATGTVLGTDPDGDPLQYSVAGGGQSAILGSGGMVVVDSTGKWTYIPTLDGGDPILGIIDDSFTIYVSDGRGGQASTLIGLLTHELKIDVSKNVSSGTVTGAVDVPGGLAGVVTFGLGSQAPTKGQVTVNADGTYRYTATSAGAGDVDTFTIVATAHGTSIVIAEVSVTPIPANRAPDADLVGGGLGTGVLTGRIDASDPDGDTVTFHVGDPTAGNSVLRPNGSIFQIDADGDWTYIPTVAGGLLGTVGDSFTVYVADGRGGTASTLVTIGTTELDVDYTNTVSNSGVTGALSIPSALSGLLTYSAGGGAPAGLTVNADGTYAYTGSGEATFTVVGTNSYGTAMTVANVTVSPNRAPVFSSTGVKSPGLGGAKTRIWTGVIVTDPDGGPLTWSVSSVTTGSVSIGADVLGARIITYTSGGGNLIMNGPAASFVIRVTDSLGAFVERTFTYP